MPKVVVITGSSRGLGFALAKEFAHQKYTVVLNGRSVQRLQTAKKKIENSCPYAKVSISPCDISNVNCAKTVAFNTKRKHGSLDIWINNAATCENKRDTLSRFDYKEIESIMKINLCGTLYGCKAACEVMTCQPTGGKIINIDGSGSNGEMIPGFLAYSTSKCNIAYIGKFLESELQHTNVQVHTISPGIMETEFLNSIETRPRIFDAIVQHPDVVAQIMVKQIESVNGSHKHINVYSSARLFMLLFNIFKNEKTY